MRKTKIWSAIEYSSLRLPKKTLIVGGVTLAMLGMTNTIQAQSNTSAEPLEEIVITGIRQSLASALADKRDTDNLIEVIRAEDIGKLPDQNLAEVLENITGIQITRTAGIGTGVQIRGSNENRVEINGVSTVGSGGGRSGIDFEDLNASIIAAVEVTKAPTAKTIEGSVGGTVNLKTIRPLDLKKTLVSARIQGEDSNQSTESIKPRLSGAFGDNWETSIGRVGFIFSGSYTEQEAVSTRPRADVDNPITRQNLIDDGFLSAAEIAAAPEEFLGIQFLLNERENDDFETVNIATTLEWAPNENTRFYADAIINEQERAREQFRIQASGVSNLDTSNIATSFESVDFGFAGFEDVQVALTGQIEPDLNDDDDDPNLRFTTETNSRVTDSEVFSFGGEWTNDKWSVSAELAFSDSETRTPSLNSTVNFINPNCLSDGTSNDNCVPFIFDRSDLSFDINFGDNPEFPTAFAPERSDLIDPNNVVLDAVSQSANTQRNGEDAFRVDLSYAFEDKIVKSIDFGYRYSQAESTANVIDGNIGGFSALIDSPNGSLFSELLTVTDTDVGQVLLIDAEQSFSNPGETLAILERALATHRLSNPTATRTDLTLELSEDQDAFYSIEEDTSALYAQANFEYGIFRGNIGARYIDTDIDTTSFSPVPNVFNVRELTTDSGSYDFFLPRLNLVAQPREDVIIRFGLGQDIRRPDFNDIAPGFSFGQNENTTVDIGNPNLAPEEVDSLDLAVEWYFAPSAVASIGYFRKERDELIRTVADPAPSDVNGLSSEDPSCPGGGIFNPIAEQRFLGPNPGTFGLCVGVDRQANDSGSTTQEGIELALQYDFSSFEDSIGWASGFGFIANATFQDFSGDSLSDVTFNRGLSVLGAQSLEQGLLDFSETAYNFTLYYEKYGLSARARYTWRDEFRTEDFGGGAGTSSTFSFPVVTDDRGQLNVSVNYDITDQFNVGVEVVNLTEEGIEQNCVTGSGPLCFIGEPDRRVTFGASYRF